VRAAHFRLCGRRLVAGKGMIPGQILPSLRTTQSDELVEISYTTSGDFDPHLGSRVPEVIVLGCKTPFPTLRHVKIQAATIGMFETIFGVKDY
jgi:hypothetical protein